MASRGGDTVTSRLGLFTRTLPTAVSLFSLLVLSCIVFGIASVAMTDLGTAAPLEETVASGVLAGVLVLLMPTLLTVVAFKILKPILKLRHVIFVSLIGVVTYSVFFVLAGAVFIISKNLLLANAVILVGDGGVFGWWLFINKIALGLKKKAAVYSLVQPAFNVVLYSAASNLVFTFNVPFNILLEKLGASVFIFALISYLILYMLDRPMKKKLGLDGVEFFSGILQNWLFDIDLGLYGPFDKARFGRIAEIDAHSLIFKSKKEGSIKAIFFAPDIHYGPIGTMGGSGFPYMLERYAETRYKTMLVTGHGAVNEDMNPLSASQFVHLKNALDRSVRFARKISGNGMKLAYSYSSSNHASISEIGIGPVRLVTLSRAPLVTEDIHNDASAILKKLFASRGVEPILIDAHNSRFEGASDKELHWVTADSQQMRDYIDALGKMGKPKYSTGRARIGVAALDIYEHLDAPKDLAPGKLNCIVFQFNGFKYAMLYFNSNNMLPRMRDLIIERVRKKLKVHAEVYTTDTHFVNSLERGASNVLGRYTSAEKILPFAEKAVREALENMEDVDVYYKKEEMKNFRVWGPNSRERMIGILNPVIRAARILVPIAVIGVFIIATFVISSV